MGIGHYNIVGKAGEAEVLKLEEQNKVTNQHLKPGMPSQEWALRKVGGRVCGRLFPLHLVVSKAGSREAEIHQLSPGLLPKFLIGLPSAIFISPGLNSLPKMQC